MLEDWDRGNDDDLLYQVNSSPDFGTDTNDIYPICSLPYDEDNVELENVIDLWACDSFMYKVCQTGLFEYEKESPHFPECQDFLHFHLCGQINNTDKKVFDYCIYKKLEHSEEQEHECVGLTSVQEFVKNNVASLKLLAYLKCDEIPHKLEKKLSQNLF
jgi:hypothetical protein